MLGVNLSFVSERVPKTSGGVRRVANVRPGLRQRTQFFLFFVSFSFYFFLLAFFLFLQPCD